MVNLSMYIEGISSFRTQTMDFQVIGYRPAALVAKNSQQQAAHSNFIFIVSRFSVGCIFSGSHKSPLHFVFAVSIFRCGREF